MYRKLKVKEVEKLYNVKRWTKTVIARHYGVTFSEVSDFMNLHDIHREAVKIAPVGRVSSSVSPILKTETATMEDLKRMLNKGIKNV